MHFSKGNVHNFLASLCIEHGQILKKADSFPPSFAYFKQKSFQIRSTLEKEKRTAWKAVEQIKKSKKREIWFYFMSVGCVCAWRW